MSNPLEQIAEEALRAATSADPGARHGRFADFMSALEQLVAAGVQVADLREFASRTAPLFESARPEVEGWLDVLFRSSYGGEDELQRALHRRSQVEFARQLYAGTPAEARFADIADDEMDRELRERAEFLALDAPSWIPSTHTWWRWLKDEPRVAPEPARLPPPVKPPEPRWIRIPAGRCQVGLTPEQAHALAVACADATLRWARADPDASLRDVSDAEKFAGNVPHLETLLLAAFPAREVALPGFEIRATPVRHDEYAEFVAATGARPPTSRPVADHPVVGVSWSEAAAFAAWADAALPDEWQWERAARGAQGSLFPWGNELGDRRTWLLAQDFYSGWPVGAHPELATAEGVHDLVTERWEWTASRFSATESELRALSELYPALEPSGMVRRGGRGRYLAPIPVARTGADADWQADGTGFRLIRPL